MKHISRLALMGFMAFSLGAIAVHCGKNSEFGNVCDDVYAGLCGSPCSSDSLCPDGLFCGPDGTCTAQCVSGDTSCAEGLVCTARGRCGGDDPEPDGGGFIGDDSSFPDGARDNDSACVDVNLTLDKTIPTVILLVDQSASMTETNPFPGQTRWDVLRNTLMDPTNGIVKKLQNEVRFGLALYSWRTGANVNTCPTVTQVQYMLGNYDAINALYQDADPIDNTPTGDSIRKVAGLLADGGVIDGGGLATIPDPGPKVIVLATDGDPDSCASGGNNNNASKTASVRAAQAAFAAGIHLYVISVGTDGDAPHQQQVANAGAGFLPDAGDAATFYRVTEQDKLAQAFSDIITGTRSCVFALNGTVTAGSESEGTVTLNGQTLAYGTDWRLNSPTELELLGASCTTVKTTVNANLTVRFPCDAVTGVIPK